MSAVVSSQGAWWFHTRTQTDRHTHTHRKSWNGVAALKIFRGLNSLGQAQRVQHTSQELQGDNLEVIKATAG